MKNETREKLTTLAGLIEAVFLSAFVLLLAALVLAITADTAGGQPVPRKGGDGRLLDPWADHAILDLDRSEQPAEPPHFIAEPAVGTPRLTYEARLLLAECERQRSERRFFTAEAARIGRQAVALIEAGRYAAAATLAIL